MKILYWLFLLFVFVVSIQGNIWAQVTKFDRITEIPVPAIENTGFGNIISGVDFDGDGKVEIYAANNMLDQGGAELIPRLYKFEWDGNKWDSVWSASMDQMVQNSWAPLTYGDLDKDGRMEIIWGPVNNFEGTLFNPPRVLVFESAGDGSDVMGIDIFGNYAPNAQWTITDKDNYNLRPFRWFVNDIDSDSKNELVFVSRVDGERFGVISVDNIPNNGDGTEKWTLETSGLNKGIDVSTLYDLAIIGNTIYLIHDVGIVTPVKYNNGTWTVESGIPNMVSGGSWKSASVVDLDNDGKKEIVAAGWAPGSNQIYLFQEDNTNGLTSTQIADGAPYIGANGRFNGGASGDIDHDGYMDFVFGTRGATPNAAIVRLAYKGGDIKNPASYSLSIIDSLFPGLPYARYDVVNISNIDSDPELEVLYTDGNQTGRTPIIILDPQKPTDVKDEILPADFYLAQNYPNPFNPVTTIRFDIIRETNVELKVFDTLGRLVTTLINNRWISAGTYEVSFNGSRLSSGTYIYRLRTGNKTVSKKMILMK